MSPTSIKFKYFIADKNFQNEKFILPYYYRTTMLLINLRRIICCSLAGEPAIFH